MSGYIYLAGEYVPITKLTDKQRASIPDGRHRLFKKKKGSEPERILGIKYIVNGDQHVEDINATMHSDLTGTETEIADLFKRFPFFKKTLVSRYFATLEGHTGTTMRLSHDFNHELDETWDTSAEKDIQTPSLDDVSALLKGFSPELIELATSAQKLKSSHVEHVAMDLETEGKALFEPLHLKRWIKAGAKLDGLFEGNSDPLKTLKMLAKHLGTNARKVLQHHHKPLFLLAVEGVDDARQLADIFKVLYIDMQLNPNETSPETGRTIFHTLLHSKRFEAYRALTALLDKKGISYSLTIQDKKSITAQQMPKDKRSARKDSKRRLSSPELKTRKKQKSTRQEPVKKTSSKGPGKKAASPTVAKRPTRTSEVKVIRGKGKPKAAAATEVISVRNPEKAAVKKQVESALLVDQAPMVATASSAEAVHVEKELTIDEGYSNSNINFHKNTYIKVGDQYISVRDIPDDLLPGRYPQYMQGYKTFTRLVGAEYYHEDKTAKAEVLSKASHGDYGIQHKLQSLPAVLKKLFQENAFLREEVATHYLLATGGRAYEQEGELSWDGVPQFDVAPFSLPNDTSGHGFWSVDCPFTDGNFSDWIESGAMLDRAFETLPDRLQVLRSLHTHLGPNAASILNKHHRPIFTYAINGEYSPERLTQIFHKLYGEMGFDVNQQDPTTGQTVVHQLLYNGQPEAFHTLMSVLGDLGLTFDNTLKDIHGHTAESIAYHLRQNSVHKALTGSETTLDYSVSREAWDQMMAFHTKTGVAHPSAANAGRQYLLSPLTGIPLDNDKGCPISLGTKYTENITSILGSLREDIHRMKTELSALKTQPIEMHNSMLGSQSKCLEQHITMAERYHESIVWQCWSCFTPETQTAYQADFLGVEQPKMTFGDSPVLAFIKFPSPQKAVKKPAPPKEASPAKATSPKKKKPMTEEERREKRALLKKILTGDGLLDCVIYRDSSKTSARASATQTSERPKPRPTRKQSLAPHGVKLSEEEQKDDVLTEFVKELRAKGKTAKESISSEEESTVNKTAAAATATACRQASHGKHLTEGTHETRTVDV